MKKSVGSIEDLVLLAEVVEAGGFSAAAALTGIPKSRLSRRISHMEQRLGVALIQRDSRHFGVTEMGLQLVEHGLRIRDSAEVAEGIALDSKGEPCGSLRIACPVALAAAVVAPFAARFVKANPNVSISISTTTGMVEILTERFDIAIHPAARPMPDSNMIAQRLYLAPFILVSSPAAYPPIDDPHCLSKTDVIGWDSMGPRDRWRLVHTDGRKLEIPVTPRLSSDNLLVLREAALAGWGVAPLSQLICMPDIAAGRLQIVAPGWGPPPVTFYAVYASRPALSLAGRLFVKQLASQLVQIFK